MKTILLHLLLLLALQVHGQWLTLSPLEVARQEAPAVFLNQRIYCVGGITATYVILQTVDVYDPSTDSWSPGVGIPLPRHHHAMCVLNGKIYIMGGYASLSFTPTDNVFMYDPDSLKWFSKAPLPLPIGAADAVAYGGKIYLIGGVSGGTPLKKCLEYDPVADTWTPKSQMTTAREHLCVALADTLIYAIAGRGSPGAETAVEVYNPANDSWSLRANLPTGRSGLDAAVVHGKIYALGGEVPGVFNKNEMYDPDSLKWFARPSLPHARHGLGVVSSGDTVYAIGGATIAGYAACAFNEAFVVANPTVIYPFSSQETISIFPNPFGDELSLLTGDQFIGERLIVYDLYGKIIIEEKVSAAGFKLRVSNLLPGIYYLKIKQTLRKMVKA